MFKNLDTLFETKVRPAIEKVTVKLPEGLGVNDIVELTVIAKSAIEERIEKAKKIERLKKTELKG